MLLWISEGEGIHECSFQRQSYPVVVDADPAVRVKRTVSATRDAFTIFDVIDGLILWTTYALICGGLVKGSVRWADLNGRIRKTFGVDGVCVCLVVSVVIDVRIGSVRNEILFSILTKPILHIE